MRRLDNRQSKIPQWKIKKQPRPVIKKPLIRSAKKPSRYLSI